MAFITARELKIYLIIVASVTVLSVSIVLIIFLPGYLKGKVMEKESVEKQIEKKVDLSELRLPEEYSELLEIRMARFYVPKGRWTDQDIKEYWVDPRKMVLDYLENKNREMIEDIFDSYE